MICVMIVADIRLYRDGLVEILSQMPELTVVGTAVSQEDAVRRVVGSSPDVVLLDLGIPDSLAAVRAIGVAAPMVKVVALAVPEGEREIIACAEAGVAGYVPREASVRDLICALHSVWRGELLCSPQIAATLLRHVKALATGAGLADAHLSSREVQVAELLERGFSNKDIARELCIEVATVKHHVHSVLEKLHVQRRGQAAARMRRSSRRRASDQQLESGSHSLDRRI